MSTDSGKGAVRLVVTPNRLLFLAAAGFFGLVMLWMVRSGLDATAPDWHANGWKSQWLEAMPPTVRLVFYFAAAALSALLVIAILRMTFAQHLAILNGEGLSAMTLLGWRRSTWSEVLRIEVIRGLSSWVNFEFGDNRGWTDHLSQRFVVSVPTGWRSSVSQEEVLRFAARQIPDLISAEMLPPNLRLV